jgi:hypothetical protein
MLGRYLNVTIKEPPGHYSISEDAAPSREDRLALKTRMDALDNAFTANDPRNIAVAMAEMFIQFPSMANLPAQKMRETITAYVKVLNTFPLWAIEGALRGVEKSGDQFPPSAPSIRKEVVKQTERFAEERAMIARVITAQIHRIPTAEERKRVNDLFKSIASDVGLTDREEPRGKRPPTQPKAAKPLDFSAPITASPMLAESNRAYFASVAKSHEDD